MKRDRSAGTHVLKTQFYAAWIRPKNAPPYWLGLEEDEAPFLFDTSNQAQEVAAQAAGPKGTYNLVPVRVKPPRIRSVLKPKRKPPPPSSTDVRAPIEVIDA